MPTLRDALLVLTLRANQQQMGQVVRRAALGAVSLFKKGPAHSRDTLSGIAQMAMLAEEEGQSWITGAPLTQGAKFDACDLRVWLALAAQAGIPFVPAREILSLHEDELGALTGPVTLPAHIQARIAQGLNTALDGLEASEEISAPATPDVGRLVERLHDAMDDVPANWMVRSHICGPSTLKTFAGAGVIASAEDTVTVDHSLEVGPGWVRSGNRRRIDATDARFVDIFAQGHGDTIAYLARPWVPAARRVVCEDPHRHGTIFAGKGSWPCEWRVFVRDGTVTGVAFYYAWAGEATPENARKALEAAALAQKMVDAAQTLELKPRLMDLVFAAQHKGDNPTLRKAVEAFGTGFSCTLDFVETPDGMMLLEGGPAHTPIGGGHPCAFAGAGATTASAFADVTGVALMLP